MTTQTLTRRMPLPSLPWGEFGVGLLMLFLLVH
jgi:hypothetical protein